MFYGNINISKENLNLINNKKTQKLLKVIHTSLNKKKACDGYQFKAIILRIGDDLDIKGKDLFYPIRIALYGDKNGPDIPIIFSILGKDKTLSRLSQVIK